MKDPVSDTLGRRDFLTRSLAVSAVFLHGAAWASEMTEAEAGSASSGGNSETGTAGNAASAENTGPADVSGESENAGQNSGDPSEKHAAPEAPADRSVWEMDDGNQPRNEIDSAVLADLARKGIPPARLASDAVFLRRVWLDVTGRVPRMDEARAFLNDPDPEKRRRLIDRLLESPGYADLWAMRWADLLRVKAEFPINLWPHGAAVYFRWIHDQIRENVPYDSFARQLLMGQGSCFRVPAANFYRAVERREPVELASAAVLTFLGERLDLWPAKERENTAKFFSRVAFKGSAQWKEEIVFQDPRPLDDPTLTFPDGTQKTAEPNQDPRALFADWLISSENRGFRRQIVNRLWFWLMGVGIIDPPDDLREVYAERQPSPYPSGLNPAVNPELLEVLEGKLIASRWDLKEVLRFILNSRTYQQSSFPHENVPKGVSAEKNLAVYPIRRLEAEVLQDLFREHFTARIAYVSEVPEPFSYIPGRIRTVELYDAGLTNPFLEMFGRSTRDSGLTTDRNFGITEAQQMFLMNSSEVNDWITKSQLGRDVRKRGEEIRMLKWKDPERYARRTKEWGTNLWLRMLSRRPTEGELALIADLMEKNAQEEILWILVNSREFLCRH
ncbi:MAG: DUF1553 domain-containing protein [Thermoguttaceae bacterium]|nr:DUF1553 domain-containing protein [Thermoguttaceae bacterium]